MARPRLPTARDLTCTSAAPVPADMINRIQDSIIGNKKPPTIKEMFPEFVGSLPANLTAPTAGAPYWLSTGAAAALIAVPMEAGDRITGLSFGAFGDGIVDCTYNVWLMDATQFATPLATFTDLNRAAVWGVADLTPFTPHVFVAGEALLIQVVPNAANYRLGNGRLVYDRL